MKLNPIVRWSIGLSSLSIGGFVSLALPQPAQADLRFCNQSEIDNVAVAVAYERDATESNPATMVSTGWWTVPKGECVAPITGALDDRSYYFFATEYMNWNYAWRGNSRFCVSNGRFTFTDADRTCDSENAQWELFHEIDTGSNADWTENLTSE